MSLRDKIEIPKWKYCLLILNSTLLFILVVLNFWLKS